MGGIGKYHHFEIASAAKLFTRLCRGDPIVAARKDDQRRVWGKCRIAPWNDQQKIFVEGFLAAGASF